MDPGSAESPLFHSHGRSTSNDPLRALDNRGPDLASGVVGIVGLESHIHLGPECLTVAGAVPKRRSKKSGLHFLPIRATARQELPPPGSPCLPAPAAFSRSAAATMAVDRYSAVNIPRLIPN